MKVSKPYFGLHLKSYLKLFRVGGKVAGKELAQSSTKLELGLSLAIPTEFTQEHIIKYKNECKNEGRYKQTTRDIQRRDVETHNLQMNKEQPNNV